MENVIELPEITHSTPITSVEAAPGTFFVRILPQDGKSAGGIILPEIQVEAPNQGIVVYAGESTYAKGLVFMPKVGDRVSLKRFGFSEITVNGEQLRQYGANDILAVLH